MKYLITIFFLLFLFCPEIKAQSTIKEDGALWVVMSDTEKSFYVRGYNEGASHGKVICLAVMTSGVASNSQAGQNDIKWKYDKLDKSLEHNLG